MQAKTDSELVELLLTGDSDAFRQFVEKYKALVFNACYNMLRNAEDAEDIAQDVFVEVYESLHQFRHESKLSTWLYRIAINKSLNHLRKHRVRRMMSSIEQYFTTDKTTRLEIVDESANDSPHSIEYSERTRILKQAIDSLPENQRIAFILTKYDELSYQETAEIMNLSLSSVESLIHRAKLSLQKKLSNYYKS